MYRCIDLIRFKMDTCVSPVSRGIPSSYSDFGDYRKPGIVVDIGAYFDERARGNILIF